MTTQELVEHSFFNADNLSLLIMEHPDAPQYLAVKIANEHDAAMARRLSEMDAENKRLREALTFAAAALHHLYSNIAEFGAVTDGEFLDGIHAAEQRARAALEHQQKGEGRT